MPWNGRSFSCVSGRLGQKPIQRVETGKNKRERGAQLCGLALSEDESGNDPDADETDYLDEHVSGNVNSRKAIPVPIGNVGRDGGKNSGLQNEADTSSETPDAGLSEKEDNKNRFEKLGSEFDR